MSTIVGGPAAHAAAPGNDYFASAAALSGDPSGSATGTNLDATVEPSEVLPDYGYSATVWWDWRAPTTGTYFFDTCGSTLNDDLGIYTGSDVSALADARGDGYSCETFGSVFDNRGYVLDATAGVTYHLQVAGSGGAMGTIVLRWRPKQIPDNDNFASAQELASTATGSVTGSNRFATSETGEPAHLIDNGSVWYKWTPPVVGDTYMFDTCGSNLDTRIGIYTGSTVASLTPVVEGDDDCDWQSQATLTGATATTYYIGVSGFSSRTWGDFTLRWQTSIHPVNDDYAAATQLPKTASGSATGNLRFATNETGDPMTSRSIWWKWTAPQTGKVIFDTCGSNSETYLQIFNNARSVSQLTKLTDPNVYGCFGGTQRLFDASRGVTYVIAVADNYGADVSLHWRMGAPSANDDFALATQLAGDGGTATTDNSFASVQAGEPSSDLLHSVWFKWIASSDASATFDLCGSTIPYAAMNIFTGASVDALTAVEATATETDCGARRTTFNASAGTAYYIQVGESSDGSMGGLVLHWPSTAVTLPAVTGLTATAASGNIKVSWTGTTGNPDPTSFQCIIGKGSPQTCVKDQSFPAKGAKTVQVRAYNGYFGTWQSVTLGR